MGIFIFEGCVHEVSAGDNIVPDNTFKIELTYSR